MKRDEALDMVKESLAEIVPDADFTALGPDDTFRDALEIDSLDFLSFIEILGRRTGFRIEDEDAPYLTTLADSADFLVARTAVTRRTDDPVLESADRLARHPEDADPGRAEPGPRTA
ncbi:MULTISPECIES: acyl carrier protein [Streptomyces]|uniref:acyl carrier protein n=1 Tax=Streptomyces TaxID=1883 RepID=UPI00342565F6